MSFQKNKHFQKNLKLQSSDSMFIPHFLFSQLLQATSHQVGLVALRRPPGRGQRHGAHSVHHRHLLRGSLRRDGGAGGSGPGMHRDGSHLFDL